jgi:hypothetical protein
MFFNKKDKKIQEFKQAKYEKSDKKRKNYIVSLPPENSAIIDELSRIATFNNKSQLIKLIIYDWFKENSIDFAEEL